jgi:predicted nucleotidyltransferase component of viral defense system
LNEPICAEEPVETGSVHPLRVSTLEDIVAEKLRALLQQPIRNRARRQDLLDIAVVLRSDKTVDRARIAEFLIRKAEARGVAVNRSAFHGEGVVSRARQDYASLAQTTRALFISFNEALHTLQTFIDELALFE